MGIRPEVCYEINDIIDVIVQPEAAFGDRHHTGIAPVSDVNIMLWQHGFHRAPQQGGEMAGQGRDDQQLWIVRALGLALEMFELTKGLAQGDTLFDLNSFAITYSGIEIESWLRIATGQVTEYAKSGGHAACARDARYRVERMTQQGALGFGH